MEISLESRWRQVLFALVVLVPLSVFWTSVLREYLAARFSDSRDRGSLEKAVSLEPSDGTSQSHLARYLLLALDVPAAVQHYEIAVALNPFDASYWLGLAEAYETLGNREGSERALQRAVSADPTTPMVAWEAANLYLSLQNTHEAMRQFRTVIAGNPSLIYPALQLSWRSTGNAELIVTEALPKKVDAYLTFLQFLVANKESQAATAVWTQTLLLKQTIPPEPVFPYIQSLIDANRVDDAVNVWNDLAKFSPKILPLSRTGNLVVNGGFEEDILKGGFDWRYYEKDYTAVSIDSHHSHSGCCSLAITFSGPAISDVGIYQFIPVQANTAYEFSAYVKAENLESANGPRFYVTDAYSHARILLTDDFLGSTSWQQVHGSFETGPATTLLWLTLARIPDYGLIKGKLLVDDLRLLRK